MAMLIGGLLTASSAAMPRYKEISVNWLGTLRTLCIGRFVVQVPDDFQLKWQKYTYNGDEIETTPSMSLARFNGLVQKREQELTENKRVDNTGDAQPNKCLMAGDSSSSAAELSSIRVSTAKSSGI
jgi:hypothetical protein